MNMRARRTRSVFLVSSVDAIPIPSSLVARLIEANHRNDLDLSRMRMICPIA